MNELECIRAFVKVVEVGSFAETARQTNTAKSVITKRVNQLEDHLELQSRPLSIAISQMTSVSFKRNIQN